MFGRDLENLGWIVCKSFVQDVIEVLKVYVSNGAFDLRMQVEERREKFLGRSSSELYGR
jgi:hypothetical protein